MCSLDLLCCVCGYILKICNLELFLALLNRLGISTVSTAIPMMLYYVPNICDINRFLSFYPLYYRWYLNVYLVCHSLCLLLPKKDPNEKKPKLKEWLVLITYTTIICTLIYSYCLGSYTKLKFVAYLIFSYTFFLLTLFFLPLLFNRVHKDHSIEMNCCVWNSKRPVIVESLV